MNTNKKKRYDAMYMDIALRVAQMSYCKRKKVGSVLVKDDRIISMGWNGQPKGFPNDCEDDDGRTKASVLHAESNLLMKLSRSHESGEGGILYVTTIPCMDCAKLVVQAGIKEVHYIEEYRCSRGKDFLTMCGISIYKHNQKEE